MKDVIHSIVFVLPFVILVWAVVEGWKLVDEVNASVQSDERFRHFGGDPLRAWERHKALFPGRVGFRTRVRNLYLIALGSFAVAFCLSGWVFPSR